MKTFTTYKHKNCTDVAIRPIAIRETETELEMVAEYIHTFYGWAIAQEVITIKKSDLDNWEEQ